MARHAQTGKAAACSGSWTPFRRSTGATDEPSGGPSGLNLRPDLGALWLHGGLVAIRETRYDTGRGGLVPASWELVCRNRNGREHVAARHVVTFDVGVNDQVVYSNGYGVFRPTDGDWQAVTSANLVENVCL